MTLIPAGLNGTNYVATILQPHVTPHVKPSRLHLAAGQRPNPLCQRDTSLPRRTTNRCHPSLASSITRHQPDRTCLGHSQPHTHEMNPAPQSNVLLIQRLECHPTRSTFHHRQLYEAQMLGRHFRRRGHTRY
ncbi:hypothetical protein PoB_001079000 [Plakobranchus ocellatus]|uniref:Uncharacterized protein n=1 Tax=Plakobranchus ocellatus TaxID=259542 RepID=A0AAV3YNI6_9GAST|nr:hypothetical protein PoB_001079000 [Plakobranchus ocellatus]